MSCARKDKRFLAVQVRKAIAPSGPVPPRRLAALHLPWENFPGMSLRDTAAQINKIPHLQVCARADNGGAGGRGSCVYRRAEAAPMSEQPRASF